MGLANRTYASPVVRPSRRTMRTSTGSRPWKNSRMSNSTALKGRPRRRTTGKTFSMAKPGPRGPAPKPGPIPPTMPGPKPIGFIIAVGSMSSVLKHARREKGTRWGGSSARRDRGPRFSRSAKHVSADCWRAAVRDDRTRDRARGSGRDPRLIDGGTYPGASPRQRRLRSRS